MPLLAPRPDVELPSAVMRAPECWR